MGLFDFLSRPSVPSEKREVIHKHSGSFSRMGTQRKSDVDIYRDAHNEMPSITPDDVRRVTTDYSDYLMARYDVELSSREDGDI